MTYNSEAPSWLDVFEKGFDLVGDWMVADWIVDDFGGRGGTASEYLITTAYRMILWYHLNYKLQVFNLIFTFII